MVKLSRMMIRASVVFALAILVSIPGCSNFGRKKTQQPRSSEYAGRTESTAPRADGDPAGHGPPLPEDSTDMRNSSTDQRSRSPGAIRADALVVNNETIRVVDILEAIQPRLEQLGRELPEEIYYQRAAQLVRLQIVEAVAQHLIWRRASAHVNDDLKPQLDKAVDRMEKERINREFGGRETVYEKFLTKHGKTRSEVRERLQRTVVIDSYLRDRLLPLVPMPRKNELWEYYQAHRKEFESQERREMFLIDIPVRAFVERSGIYGPSADELAAAREKARAAAEAAAAAIAAGESFEEVARKHSHGPRKEEGGAWGFITLPSDASHAPLQGRWAAPSKRLFELDAGEVSEIIEDTAAGGFFIVKAGKVEPASVVSFQDAQPEIIDVLRQQRFVKLRADFLQAELDKSTIGSLDDFMDMVMSAIPYPRKGAGQSSMRSP